MVTVSSFKIGMSREMREELRRNLMQRRVQGVYTKATMFGYRDANMINNFTRYNGDYGEYSDTPYYVPTKLNYVTPFKYNTKDKNQSLRSVEGSLDLFGGLAGYTDLAGYRDDVLKYNNDEETMRQSLVYDRIHNRMPQVFNDYNTYCDFFYNDKLQTEQNKKDRLDRYIGGLVSNTSIKAQKIRRPEGYGESNDEYIYPERVLANLNKYKANYGESTNGANVYGITGNNQVITYDISDKVNKASSDEVAAWEDKRNKIDDVYLEGETRTFNHKNNITNYLLYNENTMSGITHSKDENGDDGVSDGSTFSFMQTDDFDPRRKTLLGKTNELFSKGKIKSLINRFYTSQKNAPLDDEISSATRELFGMSRGRNLLKKEADGANGYNNPYCRVWTSHHQYSNLKDRIRPFMNGEKFMTLKETQARLSDGLRPNDGSSRLDEHSSLMSNGFVRMAPANVGGNYQDDIKRCMFSIENLAWRDVHITDNLSAEQRGPNNGRIMWFPPYDLKFNENVSANWSENEFIGRGENIYTYTNTRRMGNLSFKLLIDHPSVMNKWRGMGEPDDKYKDEETLLRFFAGCDNLSEDISAKDDNKNVETEREDATDPTPVESTYDVSYIMFFPNDFSSIDQNDGKSVINNIKRYEYDGTEWDNTRDKSYENEKLREKNEVNKNSEYLLNSKNGLDKIGDELRSKLGLSDNDKILTFDDLIYYVGLDGVEGSQDNNYYIDGVDVKGFASSHGYESNNMALCRRRASAIASVVKYKYQLSDDKITRKDGSIIEVNDVVGDKDVNRLDAKMARCAIATFHIRLKGYQGPSNSGDVETDINVVYEQVSDEELAKLLGEDTSGNMRVLSEGNLYDGTITAAGVTADSSNQASITKTVESTENQYDDEYTYFKNLEAADKLYYKNIIDKIRYFTPAFHSITPEGFNARLTFLQQCMRQGPTQTIGDGNGSVPAGNLAFGRAPYCVLRIGDFFNTKIVIESMSISYESGNGVTYDLNPEGIGVQPMLADINLSFSFIGGQDIAGPVDRLQNAVSYNYYANASVYDRHADYYTKYKDGEKVLSQYDAMKPDIRTEITTKIQ